MASPQTIQPSTIDTVISEAAATTNYETTKWLKTSPQTGARYRGIYTFDFSAVVPDGVVITLARLSLCCSGTLGTRTITVYRLLRTDWVEAQATWNIYKTDNNWTTAGALSDGNDFTSTDAATAASVASDQWLNETVTAQVQTALDSVSGVAHFLVADVGSSAVNYTEYYSREQTTTTQRPKLYIEYANPGPPALLKTVNGLAVASVKTLRSSVLIASGKTWNGLA